MRGIITAVGLLALAACGKGGAASTAASRLPPEIVRALQAPDDPYRIIYHPAVDLAKPLPLPPAGR
jgi:hypothetical protein